MPRYFSFNSADDETVSIIKAMIAVDPHSEVFPILLGVDTGITTNHIKFMADRKIVPVYLEDRGLRYNCSPHEGSPLLGVLVTDDRARVDVETLAIVMNAIAGAAASEVITQMKKNVEMYLDLSDSFDNTALEAIVVTEGAQKPNGLLGALGLLVSARTHSVVPFPDVTKELVCVDAAGFKVEGLGSVIYGVGSCGYYAVDDIKGYQDDMEEPVQLQPLSRPEVPLEVQPIAQVSGHLDLSEMHVDRRSSQAQVEKVAGKLGVRDLGLSKEQQIDRIYEHLNNVAAKTEVVKMYLLLDVAQEEVLNVETLDSSIIDVPFEQAVALMARRVGRVILPGAPLFDESTLKDGGKWNVAALKQAGQ